MQRAREAEAELVGQLHRGLAQLQGELHEARGAAASAAEAAHHGDRVEEAIQEAEAVFSAAMNCPISSQSVPVYNALLNGLTGDPIH